MFLTLYLMVSMWWQVDLATVRTNFEQAASSRENTAILYNSLKDYNKSNAVLLAYKGASSVLQARYLKDQKEKKKLVAQGIKELEDVVKANADNVEIRLIRLIIQENSPKILKYKMNIPEDKQMILANFTRQNQAVRNMVKHYAVQRSEVFTAVELQQLSK